MNGDLRTLENKFKDVQNKQQQRIIHSASLQLNLTAATNNLADKLKSLKNDFNTVETKQQDIINRDINILRSNLRVTTNNLENKFDAFDQKLSSTQEKQLELISDMRNHGHGNKQRIDQLTAEITKFRSDFESFDQQVKTVQQQQAKLISKDDLLAQRMNDSLTNITFYMNQIERQALGNITDLSSQMNSTTKKVDVLWINLLNSRDLVVPILENYTFYGSSSEIIKMRNTRNVTLENEIRSAIDEIDLNEVEFKRIVTDRIRIQPNDIKLHPIDSNLKKVKITFTVQSFERNNLYFTLGSFDG